MMHSILAISALRTQTTTSKMFWNQMKVDFQASPLRRVQFLALLMRTGNNGGWQSLPLCLSELEKSSIWFTPLQQWRHPMAANGPIFNPNLEKLLEKVTDLPLLSTALFCLDFSSKSHFYFFSFVLKNKTKCRTWSRLGTNWSILVPWPSDCSHSSD